LHQERGALGRDVFLSRSSKRFQSLCIVIRPKNLDLRMLCQILAERRVRRFGRCIQAIEEVFGMVPQQRFVSPVLIGLPSLKFRPW